MTETVHKVRVQFEGDSKSVDETTRRMAKDANKVSKEQKKSLGDAVQGQKKLHQVVGNPTQQRRLAAQELRDLREKIKLEKQYNQTIKERARTQERDRRIAFNAHESRAKSTFRGGFGKAMGFRNPHEKHQGTFSGRLGQTVGTGVRTGINLAGLGLTALLMAPIQAIASQYQAYHSFERNKGQLAGMSQSALFGSPGVTAGSVTGYRKWAGSELGYEPDEAISAARTFIRGSGADSVRAGMQSSRALGMDPSEIAGIFKELRSARGTFDQKSTREFQRTLAAGVKSGVDASTLPEYLEGIKAMTANASSVAGGSVSSLPYAALLNIFQKSGAAGLKGARGANTLSQLEEGFKAPGGGDEGTAVVMASLGFGRAGGNTNFYGAKKMMQQGFQKDPERLKNLFDYVDNITGGGEESNLYMEGLMGGRLSLDQIETVRGALSSGKSASEVSKMLESMTATELDRLTSIDENMKAFLHASIRTANIANEDVTLGEQNAAAVEEMQDAIMQLIKDTMPIIKDTLPLIASGVSTAAGALGAVATNVAEITDFFVHGGSEAADRQDASAKRHEAITSAVRRLESGDDAFLNPTRANVPALTALAHSLVRDQEQTQRTLDSPELAARIARTRDSTERESLEARQQETLETLHRTLTAANQLLRPEQRVDDGDSQINSPGEVIRMLGMLSTLQVNMPPTARNILDRTGGGQ